MGHLVFECAAMAELRGHFPDVFKAQQTMQQFVLQPSLTDRVVSALQPTWLIGLGRARTRDQPVSRRKGYPDRFRRSPPRSSVDAMPDLI